MKKRQIIILGSLVIIVALIFISLFSGGKSKEKLGQQKKREITYVRTAPAEVKTHDLVIKANGRVGSSRNVMIISEVQGKLLPGDVKLKSGGNFNKGQLLCRIDDTEAALKLQAQKSAYLTLFATALPDLKIDFPESFKKWETFFEGIDVSGKLPDLPEIGSVKEKTFLASRNVLGEYYNIKANEEQLEKYRIYAPFNGNLVDVMAEYGTVVNPGSQIARIIHTGDLEVEVPVPVSEARFVEIGDEVNVKAVGKDMKLSGKVVRVGQYVNPNTQSVDVFVSLSENASGLVYDGMYLSMEIGADTLSGVVKIPRKALISRDEIYTVKDSFLIRKDVEVRAKDENHAYISGVEQGEDIVVEALSNPTDSMIVRKMTEDE